MTLGRLLFLIGSPCSMFVIFPPSKSSLDRILAHLPRLVDQPKSKHVDPKAALKIFFVLCSAARRGAALALPSLDPDPQYPCSCSCSARSLTFVSLYPFIVGTAMTTSPSYVLATHTHIPLESGRQMGTAGSHMHDKFPYSDFNAIVCKEGGREGGEADPSLPLPLPSSFPVFHFGLTTTTTPTTTATCVNQCSCPVSVYSECEWKCDDASRGGRRCRAVEMRREFLPHLPYITSSLVLSPAV